MGRKRLKTVTERKQDAEKRKGVSVQRGRSGRGVGEYICWIFELNERFPKDQKLTDDKIQTMLLHEFPNRNSDYFYRIAAIRNRYNRGVYTGKVPPRVPSRRYNANGDVIDAWGRPIDGHLIGECEICGYKVKAATDEGIRRSLILHRRQHTEEEKALEEVLGIPYIEKEKKQKKQKQETQQQEPRKGKFSV